METGHILWFNEARGFGMISHGNDTIFFHYSQISYVYTHKKIMPGDKVEFDIYESTRYPGKVEARNILKIS